MSADPSASTTGSVAFSSSSDFGRVAITIFATMVLLIVTLTGILVQTTWRNPGSTVEADRGDPGSFARR